MERVEVFSIPGMPEVEPGADLARFISVAARKARVRFRNGDVVVVKQKVVSKAEGRMVKLSRVRPGARALKLAAEQSKDPRLVELILRESRRIVRVGHGVIITETRHGFICANSGIDKSNVREGFVTLLPVDPDLSARRIRRGLAKLDGVEVAVVVTDTFGRPWRRGQTDVAIGCSGIEPLLSYVGKKDHFGYNLRVTEPAVVDEIAGAAELVAGKLDRAPVAVVRGARYGRGERSATELVLDKEKDLFR